VAGREFYLRITRSSIPLLRGTSLLRRLLMRVGLMEARVGRGIWHLLLVNLPFFLSSSHLVFDGKNADLCHLGLGGAP
jgi:hypothetical protein